MLNRNASDKEHVITSPAKPEPTMLFFTITERGDGKNIIDLLKKHHIDVHCRLVGQGTASSDMMDILGLGTRDKDIVISFGSKNAAEQLAYSLSSNIIQLSRGKGILLIFSLSAINNIIAAVVAHQSIESSAQGGKSSVKNEHKHSLILITVNRGYTEEVMQTARKAGATGGTVIRARLADTDKLEMASGINLEEEREIVAILVSDHIRDAVMEDVNKAFGIRTEAQAILCSVAVDKAFKI
ncbi:MAG: hypothetical protein IJ493_10550 [Clostridia bacterium]|nr:hypothetical protein [Clostridia bacterium]